MWIKSLQQQSLALKRQLDAFRAFDTPEAQQIYVIRTLMLECCIKALVF